MSLDQTQIHLSGLSRSFLFQVSEYENKNINIQAHT